MKLWVPVALGSVVALAYAFFYFLSSLGGESAGTLTFANSVGLAAVVLGILAAGFVLRRATPPR